MLKLVYSLVTDSGSVRAQNQDNFIVGTLYQEIGKKYDFPVSGECVLKKPFLIGVFDGMGGEERGEMASLIASETASKMSFSKDAYFELKSFIKQANNSICSFAAENQIRSTGTTAAMLLFGRDHVYMMNVGDSPIFQMTDQGLKKLSTDDVSVPIAGRKPPLTQNLGIPEDELTIEPHISRISIKKNDRFLICSDGLTDMVSEEHISEIFRSSTIGEAAQKLKDEALHNGGRDNVTIITVEVQKAMLSLKGWV